MIDEQEPTAKELLSRLAELSREELESVLERMMPARNHPEGEDHGHSNPC
jgi:hypothetical protein